MFEQYKQNTMTLNEISSTKNNLNKKVQFID
jgi:hypothetical protein